MSSGEAKTASFPAQAGFALTKPASRLKAGIPLAEIARDAGHSDAYIRTRAPLAFLSPKIQHSILAGTQPSDLTLARIVKTGVPLDWDAQAKLFGFE